MQPRALAQRSAPRVTLTLCRRGPGRGTGTHRPAQLLQRVLPVQVRERRRRVGLLRAQAALPLALPYQVGECCSARPRSHDRTRARSPRSPCSALRMSRARRWSHGMSSAKRARMPGPCRARGRFASTKPCARPAARRSGATSASGSGAGGSARCLAPGGAARLARRRPHLLRRDRRGVLQDDSDLSGVTD